MDTSDLWKVRSHLPNPGETHPEITITITHPDGYIPTPRAYGTTMHRVIAAWDPFQSEGV